jgi:hypothetical protein
LKTAFVEKRVYFFLSRATAQTPAPPYRRDMPRLYITATAGAGLAPALNETDWFERRLKKDLTGIDHKTFFFDLFCIFASLKYNG